LALVRIETSALIKALGSQNAENRCKIALRYRKLHDKELKAVIHSECGGDFGTALQFLSVPTDEMECDMISRACSGLGTNELVLYPIICGRTNEEIDILKRNSIMLLERIWVVFWIPSSGETWKGLFSTAFRVSKRLLTPNSTMVTLSRKMLRSSITLVKEVRH
jgi:hypothetical protein